MRRWLKIRLIAIPVVVILLLAAVGWVGWSPLTRPPDLTGEVLSVRPDGGGVQFMMGPAGAEYEVRVDGSTWVWGRPSGGGTVGVGQRVRVWHVPGVQFGKTLGGGRVHAEWVVIDSAGQ
jgi:hypothetical protein